MSVLVIDMGNTQVKLVRWNGEVPLPDFGKEGFFPGEVSDKPLVLGSLPTELITDGHEFSSRVMKIAEGGDDSRVLVSVVPEGTEILKATFPGVQVVAENGEYAFPHEIRQVHTVGPDRFCNMAAAVSAGMDSALVVDAGTATTFDLLLDGVFKGGLIAPGMAFAARQLARQGAMLEEVSFEPRPAVVGRDTKEAMMGGGWLTGCGGVQWTIARLLETYGELPVILTGGLSGHLKNDQRYWDPWWTLRGAAALAGKARCFPGPEAR